MSSTAEQAPAALRAAALGAAVATAHTAVNVARLQRPPVPPPTILEPVSVLVPARDEAPRIGACVRALLGSSDLADLEVIVGDDGSSDGTAELARAAGEGDPRLRVESLDPPPPGWLGKPHACARLGERARGAVLVFVDADTVVEPHGVAATVALLRAADVGLCSPYPRQRYAGALARLVQPLLQWSWLTFLPVDAAQRSPRPSLTAANGQLLALDATVYRRLGGHEAVADDVLEDIGLAKAVKRVGARPLVTDGSAVASCSMYGTPGDLVAGYAKNLAAGFGSSAGTLVGMGGLAWLYVLPAVAGVVGAARGRWRTAAWGALGYSAGVAGRLLTAGATRGPQRDAWAHPASVAALCALAVVSVRRRARGTATWKGRAVTGGTGPQPAASLGGARQATREEP